MPSSKRLLVGAAALPALALVFVVCRFRSPETNPTGISLEESLRRAENLRAQHELLSRAWEARRQIRVDLLEQRQTYAQAVAALRAENEGRPPALRSSLHHFPGRTEEERYSWMLLVQVAWDLADDPRALSLLPRVRAQCRRHLARLGADPHDFARSLRALIQDLKLPLAPGRADRGAPPGRPTPDDWDIPRLVAYLNSKGLGLRVVSTLKVGGGSDRRAFLTTTDKGWEELSRPLMDPSHIDRWRGTLHCERGPAGGDWAGLTRQWDDCCLVVGPFLLFGDGELLVRVRAALADLSQPRD